MSTTSYKYHARYSHEEVASDELLLKASETNQSKSRSFCCWCWDTLLCWFQLCCSSRIRVGISLVGLLGVFVACHNAKAIVRIIDDQNPHMARWQSYAFVDEPKWKWRTRIQFFKRIHSAPLLGDTTTITIDDNNINNKNDENDIKNQAVLQPFQVSDWYDSNVLVDFTCPTEEKILATDRRWWICNPHQFKRKRKCIVYTTGPPDKELRREKRLAEMMPSCTIHSFKPCDTDTLVLAKNDQHEQIIENNTATTRFMASNNIDDRIVVHPWGFGGMSRKVNATHHHFLNTTMQLYTIKETMNILGHKSVDLLIVECAGCEWELEYQGISQLLIQMHGLHDTQWFERMVKERYVLFHKEPVLETRGQVQVLSFLRLRPGFFPYVRRRELRSRRRNRRRRYGPMFWLQ